MTTQALERIALIHPLGDMGDRNIQGLSTVLANQEWHLETDYHRGSIGDVSLYRNTSVYAKDAKPTWQLFACIPHANIKAYLLAGALPSPGALSVTEVTEPHAEPQAKNQTPAAAGARATQ